MGIRRRTRPGLLALLLAAIAPAAPAADPGDAPAPTPASFSSVRLRDGRVLHNARVMSSAPDGIVFNADEGLIKVPRANLPDDMAGALPAARAQAAAPGMVMQPFNPNPGPEVPAPAPKPGPPPSPSPAPKPTPNPVFRGCSITSFQPKPFQSALGAAEVVISNGTDAAVSIVPGDITCVTDSGARLRGRQFAVDAYPPILRRRESVPPRGSLDEQVIFSNDAVQISAVLWSR